MAARQERSKLRKIKGYGSIGFQNATIVFIVIQIIKKPAKNPIKVQLPPNDAILSATFSPNVHSCDFFKNNLLIVYLQFFETYIIKKLKIYRFILIRMQKSNKLII